MGTVTLSTQEPLVDMAITATLRDSDGTITAQMWQWKKSMDKTSWMDATGTGAMTMSYTPAAMDVGYYLRATVSYTDKYRSDRMAYSLPTGSMVVANNAPMFETDMATREVAENTAAGMNVGAPVTATDADTDDTLAYTLSGDDDMYFTIDNMGQIMVGMDTMLDYEAEKSTYMVTVTATDDSDAPNDSASIAVTINVTDVNEAPMFETDMATREVAENTAAGMNVGAPVTATDADTDDTLTYALSGDDAMYFSIDTSTGQIMVGMDTMLDHEAEKSYMVTVTATDPDNETDTIAVTINVSNVNEAPMFETDMATREVEENTAADMAIGDVFPEATDPDAGDSLTYSLGGDDADSFEFDAATRQIKTKAALDYEDKSSYSVMVIAEDSEGLTDTIEVTINVTDVEENPLLVKYDRDGDGIDRGDVIAAIDRYFAEEPGVDRAEIIALIGLYFAS